MKAPSQMSRTAIMVEGALMIAIAFVLSSIYLYRMPLGGKITCFSTLPIVMMSLRHNFRWGMATALVYSLAQLAQGVGNLAFLHTFGAMLICVLFDYVVAFTCLGLTGPIARRFSNGTLGLAAGVLATGLLRFGCSFAAGILIWPPDTGVLPAAHSFLYNITWCAPDVLIVLAAALLLSRVKALYMLPATRPATHRHKTA